MFELTVEYVSVELLDPNPWNPNVQDDRTANAERESIETYGFIDPVTVRVHPDDPGRWQIIDGEHRVREAVALGHTTAPVVVLDVDDEQAKKLTVILNETRGDHDIALLGSLMANLHRTMTPKSILIGMSFTEGELGRLLEIGRFTGWDNMTGDAMAEIGREPAPPPPTFVVEFATGRDARQFEKLAETLATKWDTTQHLAIVRAVKEAVANR